jgi:hypothetical protein
MPEPNKKHLPELDTYQVCCVDHMFAVQIARQSGEMPVRVSHCYCGSVRRTGSRMCIYMML